MRLAPGETFTSVARPRLDVEVRTHGAAAFRMLLLLATGARLDDAYRAVVACFGALDLEALLADLLASGLIVDIEPREGPCP